MVYLQSQLRSGLANLFAPRYRSLNSEDPALSNGLLSDTDDEKDFEKHVEPQAVSTIAALLCPLGRILRSLLLILVPSFVTNLFSPSTEPRKLHPTSFLDGVRGCAASIVAYIHLVAPHERWLLPVYGAEDKIGSNVLQLPFIRVLFAARPMVHIFMVISGYVLSLKAVRYMRRREHDKMLDTIVSMIVRRGMRLFLPSIAGLALMEFSAWAGWQHWQAEPTLWGKIYNVYLNAGRLVYSWHWDFENDIELLQLWTIPVEFSCSMMLFLVLIGVSKMRAWIRFAIIAALMVHCHACMRWGPFEFLAGMMLAEVDEIVRERREERQHVVSLSDATSTSTEQPATRKTSSMIHTAFWLTVFLLGLFLAGYPEENAILAPGFDTVVRWTPQIYLNKGIPLPSFFAFSIAAVLIIASICRLPLLQKPFTTPFAQYLGDLSYGLYIVHYMTVLSLEWKIVEVVHFMTGGNDTQLKRIVAVFLEITMLMVIVIWQADLFWRFIDKPVVRFARVVEMMCKRPDA